MELILIILLLFIILYIFVYNIDFFKDTNKYNINYREKYNIKEYNNENLSNFDSKFLINQKFEPRNPEFIKLKKIDNLDKFNKFIIILDFPYLGGGTTFFLNSILSKYSQTNTFLIIRTFNANIHFYINDEFKLDSIFFDESAITLLHKNRLKIEKIFINSIIGHSKIFIDNLLLLNNDITSITHDYSLLYDIWQPENFNELFEGYKIINSNINIKIIKTLITQDINNLPIFDKYLEKGKDIVITSLPDYKNKLNKIISNNLKIVVGVLGHISNVKGRELIVELINNNLYDVYIFGNLFVDYDRQYTYSNITELNELLIKFKPNIWIEASKWPETYSYCLTLSMITELPILYLHKDFISVVENRLSKYPKAIEYSNIKQVIDNKLIEKHSQNYFYTISPIIYYNEFWEIYFSSKNNQPPIIETFNNTNIYKNGNVCFIHVCNIKTNDEYMGQKIFLDQINYIRTTKLYDKLDYIYVTILGEFFNLPQDNKIKLIYYSDNTNEWEFPHINNIKKFSDNLNININILQIHTKGVLNKPHSYEWRKYLEYFLIEKYDVCLEALENYHSVGVNAQYYFDEENKLRNHYSGNFWWAKSNYIKNLEPLRNDTDRYTTEHWLIGNLFLNDYRFHLSLHHTNIDFYKNHLNQQEYNIESIKNKIIEDLNKDIIIERPIFGVFFICCIGNYLDIISEQIKCLIESKLYESSNTIYCFVCQSTFECINYLSKYTKIKIIETKENLYEQFALNNMKKYLHGDYYIYYIHSKGVTNNSKEVKDWTNMLNYFTINKWVLSIKLLKYYDTVGCNLNNFPKKHYSGNFWWSKSEHINKLNICGTKYLTPEMYILSYMKTNYIQIYNSNVTHYNTKYSKDIYVNKSDNDIINNICGIPKFNIVDNIAINIERLDIDPNYEPNLIIISEPPNKI
jgi:hypothetical protein